MCMKPTIYSSNPPSIDDWMTALIQDFRDIKALAPQSGNNENFPPYNVVLDKDSGAVELEFALAGYAKEDISVTLAGNSFLLAGKKAEDKKEYVWKGIKTCSFERKYILPAGKFDVPEAKATFNDGMLRISIPPIASEKPKNLTIL